MDALGAGWRRRRHRFGCCDHADRVGRHTQEAYEGGRKLVCKRRPHQPTLRLPSFAATTIATTTTTVKGRPPPESVRILFYAGPPVNPKKANGAAATRREKRADKPSNRDAIIQTLREFGQDLAAGRKQIETIAYTHKITDRPAPSSNLNDLINNVDKAYAKNSNFFNEPNPTPSQNS